MMMGAYGWDYYVNWAENEPIINSNSNSNSNGNGNNENEEEDNHYCAVMKQSDGKWYSVSCDERYEYFIVKKDKIDIGLSMSDSMDDLFEMELVNSSGNIEDFNYANNLLARIVHSNSGQSLAMDAAGFLYETTSKENTESYFYFLVDETNNKFAIKSHDHDMYLKYEKGSLRGIYEYGTQFTTDEPWSYLAKQNLKISIVSKADIDLVPKMCTMNVYDFSPERYSYYCQDIYDPNNNFDNHLSLENIAYHVIEEKEDLSERVPVPDGRTRCENESPLQTATCTSSFGNSIIVSETLTINAGWTMNNDVIIEHGQGWINIDGFTGVLNNPVAVTNQKAAIGVSLSNRSPQFITYFYYALSTSGFTNFGAANTKSYVESRTASVMVPVAPKTSSTIQWWTSTLNIETFFELIYRAKGGFELFSMGFPIVEDRSISDITDIGDLYFSTFQTVTIPEYAELIVTVDNKEFNSYRYPTPKFEYFDGSTM